MMEAKRAHAGGMCPPTREMGMGVVRKPVGRAHPGPISLGCQPVDAELRG